MCFGDGWPCCGTDITHRLVDLSTGLVQSWYGFHGGTEGNASVHAVAVDASGDFYEAGISAAGDGGTATIRKISAAGVVQWVKSPFTTNTIVDVCIDSSGDVFVISSTQYAKLSGTDGATIWTRAIPILGFLTSCATDGTDLYLGGYRVILAGGNRAHLGKYDGSTGTEIRTYQLGTSSHPDRTVNDIVYGSGFVYAIATGTSVVYATKTDVTITAAIWEEQIATATQGRSVTMFDVSMVASVEGGDEIREIDPSDGSETGSSDNGGNGVPLGLAATGSTLIAVGAGGCVKHSSGFSVQWARSHGETLYAAVISGSALFVGGFYSRQTLPS